MQVMVKQGKSRCRRKGRQEMDAVWKGKNQVKLRTRDEPFLQAEAVCPRGFVQRLVHLKDLESHCCCCMEAIAPFVAGQGRTPRRGSHRWQPC